MTVILVLLLLLAAAAGVLGAVLKAAAIVVLSIVLAVVILGVGTYYYVRYRLRRFVRRAQSVQRTAYPTSGEKRSRPDPELPR